MDNIDSLKWLHALSLVERSGMELWPDCLDSNVNDAVARYRYEAWTAQAPFNENDFLAQRLAFDNISEAQFKLLIGETDESLRHRCVAPPAWLNDLQAALLKWSGAPISTLLPPQQQREPVAEFLAVAAPFIEQAYSQFEAGLAQLLKTDRSLPFDPANLRNLFSPILTYDLQKMINRVMALELNIARISGELVGASAEERFASFTKQLQQPKKVIAILQEYPVLARIMLICSQQWVTTNLEFLQRLIEDWPAIRSMAGWVDPAAKLVSIKGGLADRHDEGRSVLIAKFSSGERVVYKPKSMKVDVHFQDLLQWLNEHGQNPPLPRLTVIDRSSYGWMQFVAHQPCETQEQVQRFYRRQGSYLALLYILDATDLHAGNVIACGEYPYIIDLEALFQPRYSSALINENASAVELTQRAISHSVLRIGLLPEKVWSNSENEGIDISGLGTADGQLTPHALPVWEGKGRDTMQYVRRRREIGAKKNRPLLQAQRINVLDYLAEILQGFAATYALLQANKGELLSDNGLLDRFSEDEVCVFMRSARTYRRLRRESYHPDMLRDGLDRDRLFDLLWIEITDDPELLKVLATERQNLLRGDIPLFASHPGSTALLLGENESLPDFFPVASLVTVKQRVAQLSAEDCERQLWFIKASLATLQDKDDPPPSILPSSPAISAVNEKHLLEAARTIGDRLLQQAYQGIDDTTWIGLSQEREHTWTINNCGLDLDGGLPGIILFLAYLGAVTNDDRYRQYAQAGVRAMQAQINERAEDIGLIGAFDGWGGIIYTYVQLGCLWQRSELIAEAEAIAHKLPELIEDDTDFDIYSGAAGCIAALRSLFAVSPSKQITELAVLAGKHLLASKHSTAELTGWIEAVEMAPDRFDFLRGMGGIASALLELFSWTGQASFRTAALSALNFERNVFRDLKARSENNQNQQELVQERQRAIEGIGLSRIFTRKHLDEAELQAEISRALELLNQPLMLSNHSLTGEARRLEFLWQASRCGGTSNAEDLLQQKAGSLLDASVRQGWQCGTPIKVETPGLLTGIAGTGYQLMRLARPEVIPSILMLEPPKILR